MPARFDADQGRYVLSYQEPIAWDAELRQWNYDTPITWPQKFAHWKKGGPIKHPGLTRIQNESWGGELW